MLSIHKEHLREVIATLGREYPDSCRLDAPLAAYTSYKVGGRADLLISPEKVDHVERVVHLCVERKAPFFVIGKDANVLIHDDGYRGVVVSLEKSCSQIFHEETLLYVGAGAAVQDLVEYCEKHGLAGLDCISDLPGTAGCALRMNAGAPVGEIGNRVARIDAIDERGIRVQITEDEAFFGLHGPDGLRNKTLLGCWLMVEPGDRTKLTQSRKEYLSRRTSKEPLEYPPCTGVFKHPPGDYAGRLVEEAGCKALRIGGAMVSEKHANFIVNYANATARDIYEVIFRVQKTVYEHSGIWLDLEIELIGFSAEELRRVKNAPKEEKA